MKYLKTNINYQESSIQYFNKNLNNLIEQNLKNRIEVLNKAKNVFLALGGKLEEKKIPNIQKENIVKEVKSNENIKTIQSQQISTIKKNTKEIQFFSIFTLNSDDLIKRCSEEIMHLLEKDFYSLDRLHTFFVAFFRVKFNIRTSQDNKPNVIFKEYLSKNCKSETVIKIKMKEHNSILDGFNNTRNTESLSHDNCILPKNEDKIIFNAITKLLINIDNGDFLKEE